MKNNLEGNDDSSEPQPPPMDEKNDILTQKQELHKSVSVDERLLLLRYRRKIKSTMFR